MPTGYAYIRYSTRRQGTDDKDSVTRQKASIREIAATHDVEIPEENFFYEDGVSAFTGANSKKGKLREVIDQIENLKISAGDYIFVESIDRLSRERLLQAKDLVYGIIKKGVILVTTIDRHVYRLHDDQTKVLHQDLMLSVISTRAHEESQTKSIRRKSAWSKAKIAAESGEIFNKNRTPYGVIFDEEKNEFKIDESAKQEIEFVFENLKKEGTIRTLKKVNQFSKIKWSAARIKDLIKTKHVIGFYMSQKKIDGKIVFDKFIENYYPRIISDQVFLEVKEIMENRKIKKQQGRVTKDNANIFRHSCICKRCGSSLVFMNNYNSAGRRYFYMNCMQNLETGKCKNRFRYDLAVKLFLDTMREFDKISKNDKDLSPIDLSKHPDLDEATIKEVEAANKALAIISEGVTGAEKLARIFLKLSKTNEVVDKAKLIKLAELHQKKSTLSISIQNLNKSVESIETGIIPAVMLNRLSKEEQEIKMIDEEIEKLNVAQNRSAKIEFDTLKKTIDFLKTEDGRLSIINFLTSNNIKFSFEFMSNRLYTTVYYNDKEITHFNTLNDNKSAPLGIYGFDNLGNVFTN